MARLNFDIEFKLQASIKMLVPDTLKELNENQLRKLLMDMSGYIANSIDRKDCYPVKGSFKITSKPEFVIAINRDDKSLDLFPNAAMIVLPYKELTTIIEEKDKNEDNQIQ